MQPNPQAQQISPNQQPSPHPDFAIVQKNPYAQPQQPGYVPPTQYANQYSMPMPNAQGQRHGHGARQAQMEVQLIDQNLSSGCYCVWNFWLYAMIIEGIFGLYTGGKSMLAFWLYVFVFLNAIVTFTYAITMIGAMKNKDVGKAEVGLKLAFMNLVFVCAGLYAQYSAYAYFTGSYQAKTVLSMTAPFGALYYFFSQLLPALKIKRLLQSRENYIQNSNNSYNV